MDKNEIKAKVVSCAEKYGYNNKQQIKQLERVLLKCDPQETFESLVEIFKESGDDTGSRQELAGRLLFRVKPNAQFDLHTEIEECLLHFDLSVEQLPFYFVERCGFQVVTDVLDDFHRHALSKREIESLETLIFWVRSYKSWKEQNQDDL
jgi:hypothetical protein